MLFHNSFAVLLATQSFPSSIETYEQAQTLKTNIVWKALDKILVGEAINTWLNTLHKLTALNYKAGLNKLVEHGILNPFMSLRDFSLLNYRSNKTNKRLAGMYTSSKSRLLYFFYCIFRTQASEYCKKNKS